MQTQTRRHRHRHTQTHTHTDTHTKHTTSRAKRVTETGGVLTNVVGFDRAKALSKKKVCYPYKLRLFASPNLRESFCGRFCGGFISGQTESGNPWGSTEKRKSNSEIRSRKSKVIFVARGLVVRNSAVVL